MKVVDSPDTLNLRDTVICIGNFDGVHLGHRMLLEHMQELAQTSGQASVILTFFPPAKVLFGKSQFLASETEKIKLLEPFKPSAVVMTPFTHDYARTDKDVFLAQLRRLKPRTIIVGEDFRFGHQRSGTLNDLSHIPERLEVFGMKRQADEVISSTRIRSYLSEGDIKSANRLLGHPYLAQGEVTQGEQRGRQIGFPTANIQTSTQKALPLGVFAVTVDISGETFRGMANVGPRPSFPEEPPSLEVHVFDFDQDIYGQELSVWFHHFLRSQRKFSGLEDLKDQLERDKHRANEHFETL